MAWRIFVMCIVCSSARSVTERTMDMLRRNYPVPVCISRGHFPPSASTGRRRGAGRHVELTNDIADVTIDRALAGVGYCAGPRPVDRSRCQPGCHHFPSRLTNNSVSRPRMVRSTPSVWITAS
jgi:hypothetical protein